MPPPVPVPAVVSIVGPSSQEVSETLVPASSSHRQGAEARKVKRIRSGKRKIRGCEAGKGRTEAEAHLGSPSFHQSGISSDDLFGEDEVESVRPGHVEALGAAYRSLESEGGGLAPQLSVPNMAVCPQQKSPLHNSTSGVLLAASPR